MGNYRRSIVTLYVESFSLGGSSTALTSVHFFHFPFLVKNGKWMVPFYFL